MLFVFFLLIASCARSPSENAREAMRKVPTHPNLSDDLPLDELAKGIEDSIRQLRKSKITSLTFGPKQIDRDDYIFALNYVAKKIHSGLSKEELYKIISDNFDFFEVYGNKKWGEILLTLIMSLC